MSSKHIGGASLPRISQAAAAGRFLRSLSNGLDADDQERLLQTEETQKNWLSLIKNSAYGESVPELLRRHFRPSDYDFIAAEAAGTLQELMGVFHFPLRRFPDVAELTWESALAFIRAQREEGELQQDLVATVASSAETSERLALVDKKFGLQQAVKAHTDEFCSITCGRHMRTHPTPEASMLSNYLQASGNIPKNMMEALVEEVTIFDRISRPEEPVDDVVVGQRNLPEQIGPVYLKMEVARTRVKFEPELQRLDLGDAVQLDQQKMEDFNTSLRKINAQDLRERHELCMAYGYRATSEPWTQALPDLTYGAEDVRKLAFVMPSKRGRSTRGKAVNNGKDAIKMEHGGLVLLGEHDLVLGVMSLEFGERTSKACAFGRSCPLTSNHVEELRKISFDIEHLSDLTQAGVRRGAWVGPGVQLAGLEGHVHGGLALLFENEANSVFFPLTCIVDVVARGVLSPNILHKHEMRVQMLPPWAKGEKVKGIAKAISYKDLSNSWEEYEPVRFLRLAVPGVLHPAVLHSLCNSPEDEVMETVTAKAIASAGYGMASKFVLANLAVQAMTMASLLYFARKCRHARMDDEFRHVFLGHAQTASTTEAPLNSFDHRGPLSDSLSVVLDGSLSQVWNALAFASILISFVCSTVVLVLQMAGLRRYGLLTWSNVVTYKRMEQVGALVLDIPLVLMMLPVGMLSQESKLLATVAAARDTDTIGVLLAVRGALVCFKFLLLFTGVEMLGIGKRILPISRTVGATYSFLFIMMFFLGAAGMVSYCMTNELMSTITFNTYRMAFVGDYPRHTFFNAGTDDDDEAPWSDSGPGWMARFVTYCGFGILIMVTLNNIFIGIVGNTYDHFQERAALIFVRTRVRIAMEYLIMFPTVDSTSHLWICSTPDSVNSSGDFSLRTCIQDIVGKRLEYLVEEMDNMTHRIDGVEDNLGRLDRSLAPFILPG